MFKEGILGVEKISTEYRGDPQCGGKFLRCEEEILSVGGNFYGVKKRSSVRGNIVYSVKRRILSVGIFIYYRV